MVINKKIDFKPLLSIVIPVYNRQESLSLLLDDLARAIVEGDLAGVVEIIVIDDCSSCPITVTRLPCLFILRRNKQNMGAPYSRKKGFDLSQGHFVHFHDSDDTFTCEWLSQVIFKLREVPKVDLLMTARIDRDKKGDSYRIQKYFHKNVCEPKKIQSRLVYRNCMGPLGGVTFARRVLATIEFKRFASCQDWQMYIEVVKLSEVLVSCPEIKFIFNKTRDDRISHSPHKKILGHLQLSTITAKKSVFNKNIRLFYLYTCKSHIMKKQCCILSFYQRNRYLIWFYFVVISCYWRLT